MPNAPFDASNCPLSSGGVHPFGVDSLALPAAWRQWGWLSLPSVSISPMERCHGHLPFFAECGLCTRGHRSLVAAYEDCVRTLKLSDRSDPITQVLAKKIIAIRQQDAPKRSNTWIGFASQKAGLGSAWEAEQRKTRARHVHNSITGE
jgi:hypothetical protein